MIDGDQCDLQKQEAGFVRSLVSDPVGRLEALDFLRKLRCLPNFGGVGAVGRGEGGDKDVTLPKSGIMLSC